MKHPQENKERVMRLYRAVYLDKKRKWGTMHGFLLRRAWIETYLEAKREVIRRKREEGHPLVEVETNFGRSSKDKEQKEETCSKK